MAKKVGINQDNPEQTYSPPKERIEFKKLLAINPNYFGNLKESPFKSEKPIVGNTTYEEITCIGFNPALKILEATIQIKLPGGYNGTLCMYGSCEYVRFFVNYGTGWVDAGLASFNAHDIPNILDCAKKNDKPLSYVVSLPLDPPRKNCKQPVIPLVRAILSWDNIPPENQPDFPPIWGNVLEQHIQLKKRDPIFSDIFEHIPKESLKELPPQIKESLSTSIALSDLPAPGTLQLAKIYTGLNKEGITDVEPHRFGFAQIQAAIALGNQELTQKAMAEWKTADLNWAGAVQALDKTKADVSYEELRCLGLEYNLDRLVATFRIKKPAGYSGDLCTKGSLEYVAFWADWDNTCKWTYLNTLTVNVHDIQTIPKDGLAFSAILPVDLSAVRQPCEPPDGGPKIGRIRAVLSWSSPPSTVDPEALNHWGNRIDTHVQIRPGPVIEKDKPVISIIGGIGVADINVSGNGKTKPTATFAFGGSHADSYGQECPFGGLIIVQGPPLLGHKYRLWARKSGDSATEQIIKNPIHVVNWLGVGSNITPDPVTGFVTYMDTLSNMNQVLSHWIPAGDDLWEIRLELETLGTTIWHSIQLDNKSPRRKPYLAPFEPPLVTCEVHIDSGGDCKDFTQGTPIKGHFVAQDEHFGKFSLTTLPSSLSPAQPTTPGTSITDGTTSFAAGGNEWKLDTSTMKPCGYVVLLQVWDRSILNSVPGQHNYNYYDVGFCLRSGK